ncbi:uncharacterized protein LOC116341919 [Contarinia nasturtii]|uniref:uncharacterized protein LOC116341919 n=1 Tax=Contarinia nasturtii TaxID=265458 RepID=UPI0012D4B52C|nr:uncharacterized protein LOC116341919 [Contarinia nasturtii]
MNEIRNSNSRPKDWVNLMTNHIGNVEFVLKKMLGPAKDDIRKETNAEIDHLVSERSLIDKYTNKVYKFVITEPKIKDINGFEGALAQFDGKKIDAKHLKKIGNHLTSMQNTYNQVINKLTDKVPAAVTIRNEYLRIAAVQNIRQCGSLNSLRYVVSSLLQKQDALKTVLNEICTILNDYDNQRVKLAATITDFPIQSFIKN